jgi:PKD repeat protein
MKKPNSFFHNYGKILCFLFIFFLISFNGVSQNPKITNFITKISSQANSESVDDVNPEMIISGNTIHVVWTELQSNLYYCRSTDLGKTWETPRIVYTFLSNNSTFGRNPRNKKLAVDGMNVHIAVCDMDASNGWASKIIYLRSVNGGNSFEPAKQLASKGGDGWFDTNQIKAVNGKVAIVYRGTLNAKPGIFMLTSGNNGVSFTEKTIKTWGGGEDSNISDFWYDGSQMIVLWEYSWNYSGYAWDSRVFISVSNDNGISFSTQKLLNEKGEEKSMYTRQEGRYCTKIAKSGNNIHLIYCGLNGADQTTVFYALSNNNGQTFGKVTDINNGLVSGSALPLGLETVAAKNGHVYLAYLTNSLIYLSVSKDNGITVSNAKNILPVGFSYTGGTWYPGLAFDPTDATGSTIYAYGNALFSNKSTDGGITFSQSMVVAPFYGSLRSAKSDLVIDSNGNKHWISEIVWFETSNISDIYYKFVGPEPEPGKENKSLFFETVYNGKHDVAIVPSSPSLDFDSVLTAEAWVKFDLASIAENAVDISLFAKVNGVDNYNWNVPGGYMMGSRKRGGKMIIYSAIGTDKGNFSNVEPDGSGIEDTLWHHVAFIYDANGGLNNFKTYVDGLLKIQQTVTGKINQGNGLFLIGTRPGYFGNSKYQIDNVRLWNRALTQEEILNNQFKAFTGKEAGLKLFLNFDDTFKDISGNGNDAIPIYWGVLKESGFDPPIPDFEIIQNSNMVTLNNKTQNGTNNIWNYGNDITSDKVNPSYTYPIPGEYTISLGASNANSKTTIIKKVTIAGLDRIEPTQAGNGSFVGITIYGGGLTVENTKVLLRKSGEKDIPGIKLESLGSGKLFALFDLDGKAVGKWDFVVNKNGVEQVLKEAFSIVTAILADPWMSLSGREKVLVNMWQTYTIDYGNNGNVDAFGVPMSIAISNFPTFDMEMIDFEIQPNTYMKTNYPQIVQEIDTLFFIYKDYFGAGLDARIYQLIIPVIEANSSHSVHIRVKSPKNFFIESWINREMFETVSANTKSASLSNNLFLDDPDLDDVAFRNKKKLYQCLGASWANLGASALANLGTTLLNASPVGCIYNIATGIYNPTDQLKPDVKKNKSIFNSSIYKWGAIFTGCAVSVTPWAALKVGWGACKLMLDIGKSANQDDECRKAYDPLYKGRKGILSVLSFDPNEMIGPSGYSDKHWIQKNKVVPYSVLFENKSTASAPAHIVSVTDTLDLKTFDLKEFGFGAFGFSDTILSPNGNKLKKFAMDVDLRPAMNLITRVTGNLDTITGVIYWEFISLNPTTMALEEDPMIGFLPPNNAEHAGEGFVSFSVGMKDNLTTNSTFKNKASIIFDANAPILTNEYINTIDMDKPQSKIFPLDATAGNHFTLSWEGSDVGSGVESYSVYCLENDTALYLWRTGIKEQSVEFEGTLGSTYKFYSIATDNVSLMEDKPSGFDASTKVTVEVKEFEMKKHDFQVFPNPVKDQLTVILQNAPCGMYLVELIGINGKIYYSELQDDYSISNGIQIGVENLKSGQYLVRMVYGNKSVSRKVMVK